MIESRMEELGFTLPEPNKKVFKFAPVLIYDNLAYVSGSLPYVDGKLPLTGQLGDTVSIEEGQSLAEICILNALANIKKEIGSLDKIKQIVKITGFVSSTRIFRQQGAVLDGATELLINIFGNEKGRHARSAVGAPVMPGNTPVEIEMIVAVED